jgi:hypothetical protein
MCIVIDINTLASVFSTESEKHAEFSLVKKWVEEGRGFVVYGGSRYKAELAKTFRYLRLIRQMRDGGQAISIRDTAVDAFEEEVRKKTQGTPCDDQHIIGLLGAARCLLLCSGDSRSFKFVKNRRLYPKDMPRVRVYSSSRNSNLLVTTAKSSLTNVE